MITLTPFADDAASIAIDKLTIENGKQQISLYGSLEITRDKARLQHAQSAKGARRPGGTGVDVGSSITAATTATGEANSGS